LHNHPDDGAPSVVLSGRIACTLVACASLVGCPIDDLIGGKGDASFENADSGHTRDAASSDAARDGRGPTRDAGHDAGSKSGDAAPEAAARSLAGLFDGKSFQGLELQDGRRLYTNGDASAPNGGYCDIVSIDGGVDLVYGNSEPRSPYSGQRPNGPFALWGGSAYDPDSIQTNSNNLQDFTRSIVTDISVPPGVSTRAMEMTFVAPNESAVGGVAGDLSLNSFQFFTDGSSPQGMLYTSRWIWLQPDMPARAPFEFYGVASQTTDIGETFELVITASSNTGFGDTTPVWQVSHSADPSRAYRVFVEDSLSPSLPTTPLDGGTLSPGGQRYRAPVPLGEWFRIELAWNRNVGGNGWIWMALTVPSSSDPVLAAGVTVYAASGAFPFNYNGADPETKGWNAYNADLIDTVIPFEAISDITRSSSSPYAQRLTNIEVWTQWPSSGATAHPPQFN